MAAVVTVNDVIDGHVGLDVECLDRIYLNGYVPNLQVGAQVASFMTAHLGYPIPSPAIMEKMGTAFRKAVDRFAVANVIPVVRFGKDDRKIEVMHRYLAKQAKTGRAGVAAIGVAQEFAPVFTGTKKNGSGGAVWFAFTKADRRVTCYYFYVWDDDFGPGFVKVCAYFPYPMKIWLNGHEWAKRQATKNGIEFAELSNGFASATDPAGLQAICDHLGPGAIRVFAERWWSILPLPLTEHDRAAGYWWELSMRQIETSRNPGVRRAATGALILRGAGDRQPRHRPPGTDRAHLQTRPAARTPGAWGIQDEDRHLRHRGQRQCLLPALPHQTVFEGRAGAADRDRDQRPGRPGLPAPVAASRRTAGPGPCGQHRAARY